MGSEQWAVCKVYKYSSGENYFFSILNAAKKEGGERKKEKGERSLNFLRNFLGVTLVRPSLRAKASLPPK